MEALAKKVMGLMVVLGLILLRHSESALDLAGVLAKKVMALIVVLGLILLRHSESALDSAEVLAKKIMGLMVVLELVLLRHSESASDLAEVLAKTVMGFGLRRFGQRFSVAFLSQGICLHLPHFTWRWSYDSAKT